MMVMVMMVTVMVLLLLMVMLLLLLLLLMVMMVMLLLLGSDEPLSRSARGRCSSGSRPNLQHAVQPLAIHRAVTTIASPTPA